MDFRIHGINQNKMWLKEFEHKAFLSFLAYVNGFPVCLVCYIPWKILKNDKMWQDRKKSLDLNFSFGGTSKNQVPDLLLNYSTKNGKFEKKIALTYSISSSINVRLFFQTQPGLAHYEEHHMNKFLQAIFFVTFCTYFNCEFTLILNWPFSYDLKCDAMRLELTMVCVKSTLWGIKLPLRKRWDNRDLSYKCNNYCELSFSKKDFFPEEN